jgi:hypothetical protein
MPQEYDDREDENEGAAPQRPQRRRRDEDWDDAEEERPRRRQSSGGGDDSVATLIPYRNPKALISYYCGVFGLIPFVGLILGPIALIFGILGMRYAKQHPTAKGTGHAITGIVLGTLVILGHLSCVGLMVVGLITSAKR